MFTTLTPKDFFYLVEQRECAQGWGWCGVEGEGEAGSPLSREPEAELGPMT